MDEEGTARSDGAECAINRVYSSSQPLSRARSLSGSSRLESETYAMPATPATPYTARATSTRPALIIYLIDASDTMRKPFGAATRMDVVNKALQAMLRELVQRSMRDTIVQNRYHLAIFAYSTDVIDVLASFPTAAPHLRGRSIWTLRDLLQVGLPTIDAGGQTNTFAAFTAADTLLEQYLDAYMNSPAPLICHFTDGGFSTENPTPVVKRIRKRAVNDGPVLIENVYVGEDVLREPIREVRSWPGITRAADITDPYAKLLFDFSSPLPASHRNFINSRGYALSENAAMFFPSAQVDLVRLAFVASAATY